MQILLILAVLAALAVAEHAPCQPVSAVGPRLIAAGSSMLVVPLFALVCSGWVVRRLRRDDRHQGSLLARFRILRRVHVVLWLGVAGFVLYWLDWPRLVRGNWRLGQTVLLDELLILAPLLVPLVLSWTAFYEVDRAVRAGDERSTRREYLGLHVRHYLGVSLLPVLGLLATQDAAELLVPGVLATPYAAVVYVTPIGLLFLLFPSFLRRLWKTRPLPAGPLRDRLAAAAARAGFRARDILIWETNGMVVNAAVAGFLPRLRYVFLSDALLARLTNEEVEAVFGHEMGHVTHRHLGLRVLAMLPPLTLYLSLEQLSPGMAASTLFGGGGHIAGALLVLALMAVYLLVVFGAYSRLLESQADLAGCRLAVADGQRPSTEVFTSALEKLAAAGGVNRRIPGWQHASVARRVDFLSRAAREPRLGRRFECLLGWLNRLLLAAALGPLGFLLFSG